MSIAEQPHTQVEPAEVEAFAGRAIGDLAGAMATVLCAIGDRVGLFRALAAGPATAAELATRAGADERYVLEWARGLAAAGYLEADRDSGRFALPPAHAAVLAEEGGVFFLGGGYEELAGMLQVLGRVAEAFRTGGGVPQAAYPDVAYEGMARFTRSWFDHHLVDTWLPLVPGLEERLKAGVRWADVGCGAGRAVIRLARAFPRSEFVGFDYHEASIERAREAAAEAGVADRITFEVATAKGYPGSGYDFVCVFDCLHDMGDPVGASRHVFETLAPGGTWMIVEPYASDRLEDNLNPVGRMFYAASTTICTPASLAQEVGLALGAQAGEARLTEVITAGGFTHVRRATETPFNLILEARA